MENGIFQINKKLELIRYLNNLQLLRIITKITLKDQERFYFKNHYNDLLNEEPVSISQTSKIKRIELKFEKTSEYHKKNKWRFLFDEQTRWINYKKYF